MSKPMCVYVAGDSDQARSTLIKQLTHDIVKRSEDTKQTYISTLAASTVLTALTCKDAGMSIDRVIRCIGSGTASVHCKASVQFLEGYFGWDGFATGRMTVPMDCGRFGYIEAGWRWIVLERTTPSYRDKTSMDGLMGSVGLVF